MLEKLADKFERKVKSSATMRFFSCVCFINDGFCMFEFSGFPSRVLVG